MIANPPYQLFPDLTHDDYQALKRDIAERGVMVPVEYDDRGNILDGHHRVRAHTELVYEGVELEPYPRIVREGWTEIQKRTHVRRLNILRRHLTREQQRELIADQLRETPEESSRQIGSALGAHHSTVETVRKGLESSGEISQIDTRTVQRGGQTYTQQTGNIGRSPARMHLDNEATWTPDFARVSNGSPDESAERDDDAPPCDLLPHMPPARPVLDLEAIANERDDDGSVARARLLSQYSTGIAAACSLGLLSAQAVVSVLSRERRLIHRENARMLRVWLEAVDGEIDRAESRPLQVVGGSHG